MPPSDPSIRLSAEAALQRYWGFESFRAGQWAPIEAVFTERDAFAVLPTGGGKSLLYQLPAVLRNDGLVLVVSPLIALMQDQVEALTARGIPAVALTGALGIRSLDQHLTDAEFGRYRLLYVTPERLETDLFRARAPRLPVTLLAVDEAHCISEWGHDFRPAYRRIADVRSLLTGPDGGPVPILAVTATATPAVRRDIIEHLALRDPFVVVRGFDRPNLVWAVYRQADKAKKLAEIVRAVPGSGLVYAGTRDGSTSWAATLRQSGITAEAYHAGLDPETRAAVQRRWLAGETRVIAATSAFGMGIDKPDVRFVVHVALPPTLEAYYQEAGRAGRDGARAWAVLLLGDGDDRLPRALIEDGHPDAAMVQSVYDAVGSVGQLAIGSAPDGPIPIDVRAVAQVAGTTNRVVRAAVARLADAGVWTVLPTRPRHALVRVRATPEALRSFAASHQERSLGRFVQTLVRALPPEAFSTWASLDLAPLAGRLDLEVDRVLRGLAFLADRELVAFLPPGEGLHVAYTGPRAERLDLDSTALQAGRRRAEMRLDDVLRYAASPHCRRHFLLAYFGEESPSRCGHCDVCLGRHRPQTITPEDEPDLRRLLAHVEAGDTRETWLAERGLTADHRDGLADWLVHEGMLAVEDPLADRLVLTPKGLRQQKR